MLTAAITPLDFRDVGRRCMLRHLPLTRRPGKPAAYCGRHRPHRQHRSRGPARPDARLSHKYVFSLCKIVSDLIADRPVRLTCSDSGCVEFF